MGEVDNRDYLTGLYNRKGIVEKYASLPKEGDHVQVMFCDLDNFKSVNDVYGHATGDKLLVTVAELLQECAPEAYVGRLGGDEFILVFSGDIAKEQLAVTAANILNGILERRKTLQYMFLVSISIGIVRDEKTDTEFSQILHKSDAAMYQAKSRGKSCYVFYDDLEEQLLIERQMESLAEDALKKGLFKIKYLPVNNLQNSRLEKTQVYVCWQKEDGTCWTQEEFRPVLEKNGFIRKVDLFVFEETCKIIPQLRVSEEQPIKMGIEMSRLLLIEDELQSVLKKTMKQYGVSTDEIEICIDESAFTSRSDAQMVYAIESLNKAGFSVALIHFGKNFSSFRYLRQLSVNSIHFDTAYLKEYMKNGRGRQIIKTLIRLGKDLKQLMVADGIESPEEILFLSGCGCDAASGSYYSELLNEEEYVKYAKDRMKHRIQKIAYAFKDNLDSTEGEFTGKIQGDGVRFIDGISDNWGGIYFPGGKASDNVITFPEQLFSTNSYTISLWIKPDAVWSWGSVVYVGFLGGFASIVPFAGEGISIFRIYEEGDLNGWHDILCRATELHKWTFITVTYDAFSESTRYYIDGKIAGYKMGVPIMYSCRQVMLGGDLFQKSYTGSVSAFMVFDQVKTEEEVEQLYQSFLREPGFRG